MIEMSIFTSDDGIEDMYHDNKPTVTKVYVTATIKVNVVVESDRKDDIEDVTDEKVCEEIESIMKDNFDLVSWDVEYTEEE